MERNFFRRSQRPKDHFIYDTLHDTIMTKWESSLITYMFCEEKEHKRLYMKHLDL